MNVLGMGPMELLLIVVLALIVFGPSKLPEIMGQVGKAINDFRRATSGLSDEFNRTIEAELKETRSVIDETKSAMTEARTSVNSAIAGTPAPKRTAVPAETAPAPNGAAAEPAASGAPGESGANGAVSGAVGPPLADTTQWSWETSAPATPKGAPAEQAPVETTAGSPPSAEGATSATEPSGPAPEAVKPANADAQPAAPEAKPAAPEAKPAAPEAKSATDAKPAAREDLAPPY